MLHSLKVARNLVPFDSITSRYEDGMEKTFEGKEELLTELLLCLDNPKSADPTWFKDFTTVDLVEFLELSHKYFSNRSLPSIERHLELWIMNSSCPESVARYGMAVFREFQKHLLAHFEFEENHLFPLALKEGEDRNPYVELSHPEYSPNMENLIHFLETTEREKNPPMTYRIMMEKLRILERELDLHEFMEDKVLLPRVRT